MSHGHEDHDEHESHHGHDEDHGNHGHGDGHEGGEWTDGHDDGHGGHEEHGEHGASEHEEELLESAGIVNDLTIADPERQTIDLSEFFPISKIMAIRHNDTCRFDDLKRGKGAPLDFSNPRVLRISKIRSKKFADILSKKHCEPSIRSYIEKNRPVRPSPLIISLPVEVPEYGIDVRDLQEKQAADPLRFDMFLPALPIPVRAFRYFKKRRKKTIKWVFVGTAVGLASFVAVISTVGYVTTGVQRSYSSLFNLKNEAKNGADAFYGESVRIRKEFRNVSYALAPVEAVFDSPILSIPSVRMAANAVRWGSHLAEAASVAGKIWKDFETASPNKEDTFSAFGFGSSFKPTDFIMAHENDLKKIDAELALALADYSKIDSLPDPALDARFKEAVTMLLSVQSRLRYVMERISPTMRLLGHQSPERYLILNQNRDELRATWGFPGSAVFLEVYKGRIEKYEKKDIYYYDWHLFPFAENAPLGIDRITDKWGLRDANYFPEIEKNFEKIDSFYQKSGGSSLDGVVFLNQSLVTDLLAVTGPIRLDKLNKDVDADNFSTLMSVLVENKIGKTVSPKDVLFDFVESLEKTILEKREFSKYLETVDRNAKSGEILAYSTDPEGNELLKEFFPGDRMSELKGDFVYPIFTSVSGNKSDRYVFRTFELKSQPTEGCKVLNGFKIESDHRMTFDDKERVRGLLFDLGVPEESFEKQIFIQGNGPNKQFVRLLVPKGSKIVGRPPITVNTDDSSPNYTVFSFVHDTEVGSRSAAFFDYESDIADCSKEPRFIRQPGLANYLVK